MRFGRYEILARLSRGGMGEVFRARLVGEAGFEKPVALKRIFPHLTQDPSYRELFIREAKVTSRLVHANIVQVYELGTEDGQLFIAMEFIDGSDLASVTSHLRADGGRPDPHLLALVARDVAEGLAFAHGLRDEGDRPRPIVHRDVSPQNILLTTGGIAKLCDFGIARGAVSDTRTDLLAGRRVGKIAFMPPEQLRGEKVDGRADLFALGVTLWHGVSGAGFYDDGDLRDFLTSGEPPPPRRLREVWPEAPADFAAIVDRAVALDAADRYQSAGELARDLDDLLATRGVRRLRQGLQEIVTGLRHTVIHRPLTGEEAAGAAAEAMPRGAAAGRQTEVSAPGSPAGRATVADRPSAPASGAARGEPGRVEHTVKTAYVPGPPRAAPRTDRRVLVGGATVLVTMMVVGVLLAPALRPWLAATADSAPPPPAAPPAGPPSDAAAPPPVAAPSAAAPPPPVAAPFAPDSVAVAPADAAAEPAPPRASDGDSAASASTKARSRRPRRTGYLTLQVRPWAYVSIDGRDLQRTTPLLEHPLPPGEHRVTLRGADGRTQTLVVEVREGQTVTRSLTLE